MVIRTQSTEGAEGTLLKMQRQLMFCCFALLKIAQSTGEEIIKGGVSFVGRNFHQFIDQRLLRYPIFLCVLKSIRKGSRFASQTTRSLAVVKSAEEVDEGSFVLDEAVALRKT